MDKDFHEALDYSFLLIEYYKKLNLSEVETMTILIIDHLLKQGNKFITADLLSLKMALSSKEIDNILVSLLSKNIIEYCNVNNEMTTTLNPLKDKLNKEFELSLIKRRQDESDKEYESILNTIKNEFKKALNRELTPLELDKIKEWLSYDYEMDFILDSLREAVSEGKKTVKSVDKIILQKVARNDMNKEGFSAVNEKWQSNVDATFDEAIRKWNE
ncbi:MAG: DnaD domain protein [Bacilli bacterium]|nr:DnaD domain protein [Bacilli bacterium]